MPWSMFIVWKINFKHYSDLPFLKMEWVWHGRRAWESIKEVLLYPEPNDRGYNTRKVIEAMKYGEDLGKFECQA